MFVVDTVVDAVVEVDVVLGVVVATGVVDITVVDARVGAVTVDVTRMFVGYM